MRNTYLAASLSVMLLLGGCMTAMITAPTTVNAQQNIYSFKIEQSTMAYGHRTDQRAAEEFTKFMNANGYSHYKVLERHYEMLPISGIRYTVQFYK
jgi:hypothetical protein